MNTAPIGRLAWNVLQVRRPTGHAPTSRADQSELGVNASGSWVDVAEIGVTISRDSLFHVFSPHHEVDGRMLVRDSTQRRVLRVRNCDAKASDCLDQLRWGISINPRQHVRKFRVDGGKRDCGLIPEPGPGRDVERNPCSFHPDDGRQRSKLQRRHAA
jgi:hypothetical protein